MNGPYGIEVSLDSAKCVHRALNYYVDQLEYLGDDIVQSNHDLSDLVEQDPDQFGAGDRVVEYEENLARELLKVFADLVSPKENTQ